MALTDNKWIKKVNQFFPIRGHSFLPCDCDFLIIKRELRRHDRVYNIQEIKKIILKCSNQRKFLVVDVESSSLVYDVKNWWPVHYKKNITSIKTMGKPRNQ